MAWSALESFGSSGVSFVVSIIMARFLAPKEFGLVAMLQVFIAIACICVDSGMTQALVRRPERRPQEESTALLLNVSVGLAAYVLLFAAAPWVARFYGEPELCPLMQVICLAVPLNALCVVQTARLTSDMRFDLLFKVSASAVLISGALGLALARMGCGVWALAWQQVSMWGIRSMLLWIVSPWKSGWVFSRTEARGLLGFSWKLMGASLLDTLWTNIYPVLIGKFFTPRITGLFWRANSFALLPASTATGVVHRVAYPLLSRAGNSAPRRKILFLRVLGMSAWVIFPIMAILAALSGSIFEALFNEQWQSAAPLFRIICLATMLYPVHALNLMLLNVVGRSDLFLRLEVIKKFLTVAILCVTVPMGVQAICLGMLANSLIALPINMWYSGRYAASGITLQFRFLFPTLCLTLLGALAAAGASALVSNAWLSILLGLCAGLGIYILGSALARMPWLRRLASFKI